MRDLINFLTLPTLIMTVVPLFPHEKNRRAKIGQGEGELLQLKRNRNREGTQRIIFR
jgi:hypothetical protein